MKNFIIAVVLILIVTATMTANIIYQKSVLADITDLLNALPDLPEQASTACEEILRVWKDEREKFSLTMQEHETERLTMALTELASFSSSGDRTMYLSAREASFEAVRLLGDAEKLTFTGIL